MSLSSRTAPAAWIVAAAMFMENLDATILVTAAPAIAADIGVASEDIGAAMTVYLVAVACSIPLSGWLSTRVGPRVVFLTAIAAFTAFSALCAMSDGLLALCVFRAFQGIAGGMMVPVGRLIVLRASAKADLIRAIAVITWPALLAPAIAPAVGGLIVTVTTWHWIFLINVPLGILGLVLAFVFVPKTREEPTRLDVPGLLLTTVACCAVLLAFEGVARLDLASAVFVAIAVVAVVAVLLWLRRAKQPLVDLGIFNTETFRAGNSSGFVFRLVISAVPFLLALALQEGLGWSALLASAPVTALFLGNIAAKTLATVQLRRWGFRGVLLVSIAGSLAMLVALALLGPAWPIWVVSAAAFASGWFRSTGFTAFNTLQFADVDGPRLASANTVSSVLSQLAQAGGIALGATIVRIVAGTGPVDPMLPYTVAFAAAAVLLVLPLAGALRLDPGAGAHVSARPRR